MASSYSDLLRLEKQADGESSTTWGQKVNTVFEMIEDGIAGRAAVTHDNTANYTLTTANSATDEARDMILNIGGALTAARNTVCPTSSKLYVAKNATTGGYATTLKTTAGTGISIPNGNTTLLFCDGTNVVSAIDYLDSLTVGNNFTLTGDLAVNGGDLTSTATTFNLLAANATTVNAFGAASTALNIGHASAAAAFPGGISIPTGKSVTGAGTATVTGFTTVSATNLTGTLTTAAQTAITSVGTLTGLTVTTAGPSFSITNTSTSVTATSVALSVTNNSATTNNFALIGFDGTGTAGGGNWARFGAKFVDRTGGSEDVDFHWVSLRGGSLTTQATLSSLGALTVDSLSTGSGAIIGGTGTFSGNTTAGLAAGSTWSIGKATEVGYLGNAFWGAGATTTRIMTNAYYNGDYLYASSDTAAQIQISAGTFEFKNAGSGTIGNAITFTTRLAINAAGAVTIANLAGSGTRTVVVDANGVLSAP